MEKQTFKDKKVIYQVPGKQPQIGIATGEPNKHDRIGIQFDEYWGYCHFPFVKLLTEENEPNN